MSTYAQILALKIINRLMRRFKKKIKPRTQEIFDVVFVMPPKDTPGWILNTICHEIASRLDGLSVRLVHIDDNIPPSKAYFFSHYIFFYRALRKFKLSAQGRSYVFVTHFEPVKHRISNHNVAHLLAISDGVICMNKGIRNELIMLGLPEKLTHVVLGAANSEIFVRHQRNKNGAVGFSAAFYNRKYPERIFDIVNQMSHRQFILLGRGWRSWQKFEVLNALPNFTYAEPDYKDYASWYAKMTVFCTVSKIEGGPIPLMEAMFCNIVPVASRTGFAPDVIEHGSNGFLFDVDAPVGEICKLIDAAFEVDRDIDEIANQCDWLTYSRSIANVMGIDLTK